MAFQRLFAEDSSYEDPRCLSTLRQATRRENTENTNHGTQRRGTPVVHVVVHFGSHADDNAGRWGRDEKNFAEKERLETVGPGESESKKKKR